MACATPFRFGFCTLGERGGAGGSGGVGGLSLEVYQSRVGYICVLDDLSIGV